MTEHTPGPWKSYNHGNDVIIMQSEMLDDGGMYAYHIATVHDRDGAGTPNAHLIETAPDLLAALEDVRRIVANQLDNSGLLFPARGDKSKLTPEQAHLRERLSMASRIARAAIAKAKESTN